MVNNFFRYLYPFSIYLFCFSRLLDNLKDKQIFTLEERRDKEKKEILRNCSLNVDAVHIYPGTIQKFIEHFLFQTDSLLSLSESSESIESFEDSDVSCISNLFKNCQALGLILVSV